MIPEHFRNKPANVLIAVELANRTGLSVWGVMQKCYIIGGKPAFETQLAIALLECSGLIKGTIEYERVDEPLGMAATVVDNRTGRPLTHILTWDVVKSNGWDGQGHWKKDATLMMKYRAAMQLIRLHFPSVLLGMHTVEEAVEMRATNPTAPGFNSASLYEPQTGQVLTWDDNEPTTDEQAEIRETERQEHVSS